MVLDIILVTMGALGVIALIVCIIIEEIKARNLEGLKRRMRLQAELDREHLAKYGWDHHTIR